MVAFESLGSSHSLDCFDVGFTELSSSSDENEESRNESLDFPVVFFLQISHVLTRSVPE